MGTEVLWSIPTSGDGRSALASGRVRGGWDPGRRNEFAPSVRDERPGNFNYFDYLTEVARAAEAAGFAGIFVPHDPLGEDSWITATALAREVPRVAILAEFQPGSSTAIYAAKLALSFQRFFDDRLRWKLALSGDPKIQQSIGDFVEPENWIARAEELVLVTKGAWSETAFDFHGNYFEVQGGGFFDAGLGQNLLRDYRRDQRRYPKLYLDGHSDAALALSAEHADVHVLESGEVTKVGQAIDRLRELAQSRGRSVEFALRLGIIARDTAAEATRRAERYWLEHAQATGDTGPSRIDDQLWIGLDALGYSAKAGLIGSFAEIVDRLNEYVGLGVSSFIFDGLPRLEEAYRVGEHIVTRVQNNYDLAGQTR